MLNTALSVLTAIALLVPGFLIVELSVVRSARSSRSDLELALRAVTYALAVHLAFGFWTVHLADEIHRASDLGDHLWAVTAYTLVVLVLVPILIGVALNQFLGRAELGDGPPGRLAAALGAGEARDAFDYAFQRRRGQGAWVIVELVGHTQAEPRLVGGLYGQRSASAKLPRRTMSTYRLCTR